MRGEVFLITFAWIDGHHVLACCYPKADFMNLHAQLRTRLEHNCHWITNFLIYLWQKLAMKTNVLVAVIHVFIHWYIHLCFIGGGQDM